MPSAAHGQHSNTRAFDRPHVLVADRNQEIVELVAYAVDRAGLRVVTAQDEETALALLAAHRPPVVVVDIVSIGVAGGLRAAGPETAIIVLSALDSEEAKAIAVELNAAHYLSKPFSHRELVSCILACLRVGASA